MLEDRNILPDIIDSHFEHPPFRFAMVAASFIPERSMSTRLFAGKTKTPSLHIIGERDVLITPDQMETLAATFENPAFLRHTGG